MARRFNLSDWWAYKYEVNDAIPQNAAIMHEAGVVVAINSDDAEMSRRLNQEAAKAVKYGGVSEEDAWKFVTLNPANSYISMLMWVVSKPVIVDLVLWDVNPSVYSRAEKTRSTEYSITKRIKSPHRCSLLNKKNKS